MATAFVNRRAEGAYVPVGPYRASFDLRADHNRGGLFTGYLTRVLFRVIVGPSAITYSQVCATPTIGPADDPAPQITFDLDITAALSPTQDNHLGFDYHSGQSASYVRRVKIIDGRGVPLYGRFRTAPADPYTAVHQDGPLTNGTGDADYMVGDGNVITDQLNPGSGFMQTVPSPIFYFGPLP